LRREELIARLIVKLRLVQRDEIADLTLRLAQVEHRLRLLESGEGTH